MECYHYVTTGSGKNKKRKKVVTHRAYHSYRIHNYRDESDLLTTMLYFKDTDIFRLDMKKAFKMTPEFERAYEPFKNNWVARNTRDTHQSFTEREYVDGYQDKVLVTNLPEGTTLPWYASSCSMCMLDWCFLGWI